MSSPPADDRVSSQRPPLGILLLILAGLILFGIVLFRQRQLERWKHAPPPSRALPRQLAPRFELADHRRRLVKFERFLGRQRVVVIFFDAQLGADRDPRLEPLLAHSDRLEAAGIRVVAISTSTPYANQQAEERLGRKFPFPLLTDIDIRTPLKNPVHRLWGRLDEQTEEPLPALFLVARDGTVPLGPDGKPLPVRDEQAAISRLIRGMRD